MNAHFKVRLAMRVVSAVGAALAPAHAQTAAAADLARTPLSFASNEGQWEEGVRFVTQLPGAVAAFSDRSVRVRLDGREVTASFVGASPRLRAVGEVPQAHRSHFYLGNDPQRWRHDVPNFAAVRYASVWPGIDVRYTGAGRQLEYDCIVAPGGDPTAIAIGYDDATAMSIGARGELVLTTPAGAVVEQPPIAWQETPAGRIAVPVRYRLLGDRTFGYAVDADFRRDLELVIDPVLGYSTYLGGATYDEVHDIAVDATGAAYVAGGTLSPDFPASGGPVPGSDYVVFVSKLAPNGSTLLYSTFLGGSSHQIGYGLALRGTEAVVVGSTTSNDFPTTPGAFDQTFNSTQPWDTDAFVAVLTPTGALSYSTYVGGPGGDHAFAVVVDQFAGAITFVGESWSAGYPTTAGALQPTFGGSKDVVITRLAPAGGGAADLLYSTYLGGSGYEEAQSLVITGQVDLYIAGSTVSPDFPTTYGGANGGFDSFLARVRPLGAGAADLVWTRRIGGSGNDYGLGVTDVAGDAVMVGVTYSANFPTTAGVAQPVFGGGGQDGFAVRVPANGAAVAWSTFLGGVQTDRCVDVETLSSGSVVVLGYTSSPNFPVTATALDPTHNGSDDFTISVLLGNGTALSWSTFFGGSGLDAAQAIAVGSNGDWYFCGNVTSLDYPITAGAFDTSFNGPPIDAVVTKIAPAVPFHWGPFSLTSLASTPVLHWDGTGAGPLLGEPGGSLRAQGLVPGSLALLAMGTPSAVPLPLSLFGGPAGAELLLDVYLTLALVADASGNVAQPLAIPPMPALVDGEFSFQVFDFDLGLPFALPLAHSQAMTMTILP